MKKTAVVGFGRAGYAAAETLRENAYDGEICVFTDYETGVENPMLTTYYATDKIDEQAVMPFGDLKQIKEELNLEIKEGVTVTKVVPDTLEVMFCGTDGSTQTEKFDDVIIATGSAPILPAFDAKDPARIITIRNIADARRMNYALHHAKKVLVVGCSMIGIKVVQGLTEHEADITLIDYADKVFPTAVLPGTEELLAKRITDQGVCLKLNTGIQEIKEATGADGTVKLEAEFSDGTKELFDTVFLCMGTKARTDVVADTAVEVGRAIKVDDHMRTSVPHIYAAGDCCEAFEISTGASMNVALWANAAEQGKIAAENILGMDAAYKGNLICNITHFWDTDFISIGNNRAEGELVTYSGHQAESGKEWYFSAVINDGKLQCINLIDNPELSGIFRSIMWNAFAGKESCKPFAAYSLGRFSFPVKLAKLLDQKLQ